MIDAKHIAALEAWLSKTRDEQNQLMVRLRETEAEVEKLRGQIGSLDDIAQQAESMIDNMLVSMRGTPAKTRTSISMDGLPQSNIPAGKPVQERQPTFPSTIRASGPSGTVAYLSNARPLAPRSNRIEPVSNRFADRTITQACTLLLRESGVPLHVNELYHLLLAGGMEFKGNNPTISVAVSLNRNRRFKKVGPGTFDLMMREALHQAAS